VLFNFNLTALEQVQPWGEPGNCNLHWFGLTDGEYWIQAGDDALLEYSDAAREGFGYPRYCSYQVIRLYEDITEMLPHILDPVPGRLMPYISWCHGASTWDATLASWCADEDTADEESFRDMWGAASAWSGQRTLDTGYLSPSARIRLWSDNEVVHIEWDNRDRLIEGKPAWRAVHGSARVSRVEFVREIHAFHTALMSQMAQRVERVLAGDLPTSVNVDMVGLQREHAVRSRPLDRELGPPAVPTDWDGVWKAIAQIGQRANPTD
jgi:hypothetical protein